MMSAFFQLSTIKIKRFFRGFTVYRILLGPVSEKKNNIFTRIRPLVSVYYVLSSRKPYRVLYVPGHKAFAGLVARAISEELKFQN